MKGSNMDIALANLSNRDKQAYAALCLAKFCAAKGIRHPSITVLIEHLLSILVSRDLPKWERAGAALELTGNDPLPTTLENVLPSDVTAEEFGRLVNYVVEVGIINMYGADTEHPLSFLEKVISVLKQFKVEPPRMRDFAQGVEDKPSASKGIGSRSWGSPASAGVYDDLLREFREIYR
jgi:hypothetical protein